MMEAAHRHVVSVVQEDRDADDDELMMEAAHRHVVSVVQDRIVRAEIAAAERIWYHSGKKLRADATMTTKKPLVRAIGMGIGMGMGRDQRLTGERYGLDGGGDGASQVPSGTMS